MKNAWIAGVLALLLFSAVGCFTFPNKYTKLPPGPYRAVLKLTDKPVSPNPKGEPLPEKMNLQFEEVSRGELPFNMEVTYVTEDSFYIEIINGEERILLDDITFGRDKSMTKDTVVIEFPVFDSYINAIYEEKVIEGEWVLRNKENYRIPFVAYHGQEYRFTTLKKVPITDISGRWAVQFGIDTDEPYPAIGEFKQEDNHLTGTFLTETGDYRFLEGTLQADKLYLSTFDGAHAYLFEGKVQEDGTLIGSFRSGTHYKTLWEAQKNEKAVLTHPDSLTFLKPGYERFDFAFPTPEGSTITPYDPEREGKVRIFQIFGTWCPNCRDETAFLTMYLKDHPEQDISVVALAFERHTSPEKAWNAINTYRDQLDIPYPIVWAGSSDKQATAEALPMLSSIVSFPTLIIMDQNDEIVRIHTGFSGPATSEYQAFTRKFSELMQQLTEEPG